MQVCRGSVVRGLVLLRSRPDAGRPPRAAKVTPPRSLVRPRLETPSSARMHSEGHRGGGLRARRPLGAVSRVRARRAPRTVLGPCATLAAVSALGNTLRTFPGRPAETQPVLQSPGRRDGALRARGAAPQRGQGGRTVGGHPAPHHGLDIGDQPRRRSPGYSETG